MEEYVFNVKYHDKYIKWWNKLKDTDGKALVTARLKRIRIDGDFGDCEFIGDNVWELRIRYGPGYRVYYMRDGGNVILLLCGGKKSGQKRDIKRAVKLAKEVKSEKKD